MIEGERCETDAEGNVTHVFARCVTLEPGADPDDGIKPKGVIHWVSADHSVPGCGAVLRPIIFAGGTGALRRYLRSSESGESCGDAGCGDRAHAR